VLALAIFVIVGVFSPVMRVEEITITGATRVDATSISTQLEDQIGVPLPLVDVTRIEEVLRRQNLVESYSIESRPPHDLIIHLIERQPIAYMPAGTAFMLADAAGVTIETAPAYPGGFPLLHVPNDEPKGAAFESAVSVLRSLPGSLRERISEVTASTADDVSFVLGDTGQRVFWGSADDASTKTRGLLGLLANWPPGTANEYDVSSKDNVVVR
jgi:cell division protein FtsQ